MITGNMIWEAIEKEQDEAGGAGAYFGPLNDNGDVSQFLIDGTINLDRIAEILNALNKSERADESS